MKQLSIRWRLTLWYAEALAVVLTVFCLILYVLTQQQSLARTDATLREELRELLLEVQLASNAEELQQHVQARFYRHDVYDFLVTNSQGQVLFASSGISPAHSSVLAATLTGDHLELFNHRMNGGQTVRVAAQTVDGPTGKISGRAITSLAPLQADLRTLQLLMFVLVPLSFALALVGGYVLATKALAPVEQIARTASQITISNLNQRIPISNPDDELGRLAATLNSLISRLERAVGEIQRFTANASHELRTPLAVLRLEAESTLRARRTPAEYEQVLATVVDEATRLGRLADQLLVLSRHDAGVTDCRREAIRVDAIVLDIIDQVRHLAESHGISLETAAVVPSETTGDDLLLGQAIFNVLDNAIKYTPRGGSVVVGCNVQDGQIVIRIRDSGMGIPREHLGRVFERFHRVDASRTAGGAGLGLAITQTTIQMHHGSIAIDSEVDVGTTVTIRLPGNPASGEFPATDVSIGIEDGGKLVSIS